MNSGFEHIVVQSDGPVGIVTLNRPAVLNALNGKLLAELSLALLELDRHPDVRAIVLTGSGEKAFAAGADIGELNSLPNAIAGSEQARMGQSITRQMERLRKPVIVAINGFALGGGCEIAMGGDIRIASENAKFGQPEVNLGLIPGYGGSQRIDPARRPRHVDVPLPNRRNDRRQRSAAHRPGSKGRAASRADD